MPQVHWTAWNLGLGWFNVFKGSARFVPVAAVQGGPVCAYPCPLLHVLVARPGVCSGDVGLGAGKSRATTCGLL